MRIPLLLAALAASGVARADSDRAPRAPDFTHARDGRAVVDRELTLSSGKRTLMPFALLLFEFDSADIDPVDAHDLEAARDWAAKHPSHYLVIEAHADEVGSDAYNMDLASRRGESVRMRLMSLGVDPAQLVVGVFGESLATSTNDQANRRVILRATNQPLARITSRTTARGDFVAWKYQPNARAVARR